MKDLANHAEELKQIADIAWDDVDNSTTAQQLKVWLDQRCPRKDFVQLTPAEMADLAEFALAYLGLYRKRYREMTEAHFSSMGPTQHLRSVVL